MQAAATSIAWANTTDFFASLTDRERRRGLSDQHGGLRGRSGRRDVRKIAIAACMTFSGSPSHKARPTPRALGYVPLPKALVDQIEQYWAKQMPVGN